MKHLKTKLVSAIAMLAVAAIMMTSATYAWFAISTAPEIANVSASVTANGAFEIALGSDIPESAVGQSGNNNTWGNLVDLSAVFQTAEKNNVITLKPVQPAFGGTDGAKALSFKYPQYALDGRIKTLVDLNKKPAKPANTTAEVFSSANGISYFVPFTQEFTVASSADVYAFEMDLSMRTNVVDASTGEAHITLATDKKMRGDSHSEVGSGAYISDKSVTIIMTDGTQVWQAEQADTANNGVYQLTLKELNSDLTKKASENEDFITLTRTNVKVIKIYVFLNGSGLTNNTVNTAVSNFVMNLQFVSDQTLEAMEVNEINENGRRN